MKFLVWIERLSEDTNFDDGEYHFEEEYDADDASERFRRKMRSHDSGLDYDTDFELERLRLRKLRTKLDTEKPSTEVVHGIEALAKANIDKTVDAVDSVWSQLEFSSVTPRLTTVLHGIASKNARKHEFFMKAFRQILDHRRWGSEVGNVNQSVNRILENFITLYEEQMDPIFKSKESEIDTIIAFKKKNTMADLVLTTWQTMIDTDNQSPVKTKIPLDLYVPTMRRLGMHDILDSDWNMLGSWYDIITELERAGDHPVTKIQADQTLETKSKTWRSARHSQRSRRMNHDPRFERSLAKLGGPVPACFMYQTKCSVYECSHIETKSSPHSIRCEKCWYFHCCSPACEAYAKMFNNVHFCDFTPKEKALGMKEQTEKYLGLNRKVSSSSRRNEKVCNFCLAKEENLSSKLLKCSGCKESKFGPMFYCSTQCQKWDWNHGKHKLDCKNR